MVLSNNKITEIFYLIDEFCKEFDSVKQGHVLPEETSKKRPLKNTYDKTFIKPEDFGKNIIT